MSYDFLAIDFETANASRGSACSVGIAAVSGQRIVDTYYSLIKPRVAGFDPYNISVHGITDNDVANAKTLDELWPDISSMFSLHTPVFAHNAQFDMTVLLQSLSYEIADFIYVDTLDVAHSLGIAKVRLDHCADVLHIQLGQHHNALDDAQVCAMIAVAGIQNSRCLSVWEYLATSPDIGLHHYANVIPAHEPVRKPAHEPSYYKKYLNAPQPRDISPTVCTIDKCNRLYGKNVVFTGELSIDRRKAMQIAVNCGATVKSSVSKKVHYLVLGEQDPDAVGASGHSTKELKAHELNSNGQAQIQIINEREFLELADMGATV